jgi:hypothetical protein
MDFSATVELGGKTATGIEVPPDIVATLGPTKKPPVVVTINGFVYRTTVAVMAGRFLIPLSAENRAGAGVAAGDVVEVRIEPDTEPRRVDIPEDLATALAAEPGLHEAFTFLSYSHQRQHVLAVEGARTDATRQRRIDGVLAKLRG